MESGVGERERVESDRTGLNSVNSGETTCEKRLLDRHFRIRHDFTLLSHDASSIATSVDDGPEIEHAGLAILRTSTCRSSFTRPLLGA